MSDATERPGEPAADAAGCEHDRQVVDHDEGREIQTCARVRRSEARVSGTRVGLLPTAARAGGRLLSAATAAVAAVRPAAKPLHPRGTVVRGTLHRSGTAARPAAWCDEAGVDEVVVRRSRAVGLPAPLPDIFGLAIRVPTEDGPADLLFATTGLGRLTRFTLTPSGSADGRPMTTLLPYRSPHGPVLLGAAADHGDGRRWTLLCASPGGRWTRFGHLELHEAADDAAADAELSFDPLRHTAPGLANYRWVQWLREPAYRTARHSRGDLTG